MLMNELNEETKTAAVSPLKHDFDGRFSRKGVKKEPSTKNSTTKDCILVALFICFLLFTDFILFAGSGNVQVFNYSFIPIPEVCCILLSITVIIGILVYLSRKIALVRNLLAAFFSLGFVYVIFKQFAQFHQNISVGSHILPISLFIGCIFAAITYLVFSKGKILTKSLYVTASAILFLHVYFSYATHCNTHEFMETHNVQKDVATKGKKFIYLLLPNLTSYATISTFNSPEALKTQKIMRGFWRKNDFKIYLKAYTPEDTYLNNVIRSLNPTSQQDVNKMTLNTRIFSEYWRFHNLRKEYVYLKNNELFDIFKFNKFQTTAYKSRDFDLCHKAHKPNISRCIEKVNHPINLYDTRLTTSEKSNILMVEWLSSMGIFNNLSSVYRFMNPLINMDNVPMVGVNYNNLYVVNSAKTFDVLFDNIRQDKGKQAYFVFVDLPSDMYIYDEFCQIKPKNQWLNMINLPWINNDYTDLRKTAYLQQTQCLFGKLEEFAERLKANGLWQDTVLVMQGISGINNFSNEEIADVKVAFLNNHSVIMAIHDQEISGMEINKNMCTTSDILSDYLFYTSECNVNKLKLHEKIVEQLSINMDMLNADIDKDTSTYFAKWYTQWQQHNGYITQNVLLLKQSKIQSDESVETNDEKSDDLKLNNLIFSE